MKIKELISEPEIRKKVAEIAQKIEGYIGDDDAVFIANLKGSFLFFADLVRNIKSRNISVDFVATESYCGTDSTGNIKITRDLCFDIKGKKIVLVEDIVDTGLTLHYLIRYIKQVHEVSDIKICVLLDKPSRRKVPVEVDYSGFTIEDRFVVGYGLDYNEKFRNLPYIAELEMDHG